MEQPKDLPLHSLLKPQEVAAFLRISKATVFAAIARGALPALRWGNTIRIPRARLLAVLHQHESGASDNG